MIVPTTAAELVAMSLAMMIDLGGGTSGVLIDKTVNTNGTYIAADDNADGYKTFTRLPNLAPLTVTENGWYYVEYGSDIEAFDPIIVNVKPDYEVCGDTEYNDLSSIADLGDDQYIFDVSADIGVQCVIEPAAGGNNKIAVYKVEDDGAGNITKTEIYSHTTGQHYDSVWFEVVDSYTGEFNVHYKLTGSATEYTANDTESDLIRYGRSGDSFLIKQLITEG